jgi:hypothetical protein
MECVRCLEAKNDADFYANDRTCKICRCAKVRYNRAKKLDYYTEYDKKRAMLPHRVEARSEYQKTDAGKASMKRARGKWQGENGGKRAAHVILGNAVRDRRIEKPESCSRCESTGRRIHGHHDDYAYPLQVRWLCSPCHNIWHKEYGEGLNG